MQDKMGIVMFLTGNFEVITVLKNPAEPFAICRRLGTSLAVFMMMNLYLLSKTTGHITIVTIKSVE